MIKLFNFTNEIESIRISNETCKKTVKTNGNFIDLFENSKNDSKSWKFQVFDECKKKIYSKYFSVVIQMNYFLILI